MNHREQALEFLRRFAFGDIDGLEPLLAEDLQLAGPYLRVESRAAWRTAKTAASGRRS
jgi:hypothetical protein